MDSLLLWPFDFGYYVVATTLVSICILAAVIRKRERLIYIGLGLFILVSTVRLSLASNYVRFSINGVRYEGFVLLSLLLISVILILVGIVLVFYNKKTKQNLTKQPVQIKRVSDLPASPKNGTK